MIKMFALLSVFFLLSAGNGATAEDIETDLSSEIDNWGKSDLDSYVDLLTKQIDEASNPETKTNMTDLKKIILRTYELGKQEGLQKGLERGMDDCTSRKRHHEPMKAGA